MSPMILDSYFLASENRLSVPEGFRVVPRLIAINQRPSPE